MGGGPAGATVARILAARGLQVCLLERDLNHQKPCGGGMPDILFREFSLPLPTEHRSTNIVRIVSPSGRQMEIELEGGKLVLVSRQHFDRMLRQLAADSGAEVIEGSFLGIKARRRNSLIVEAMVQDQRRTIKTRYLVGADGVNSSVRRALGLPPLRKAYTLSLKTPSVSSHQCQFWFSRAHAPEFYSWIFPSPEGASIGTGSMRVSEARALLERFAQRAGLSLGPGIRGYWIPLWSKNESLYREGVFLVGDAAAQVMPFTYEGIYYSMKSAEFVAEAIIKDRPGLYRQLWQKRFLSRFKLMDRISRYFYRADQRIEVLFDIFQRRKVQELSMKLWLQKDTSRGALLSYIGIFRRFLF